MQKKNKRIILSEEQIAFIKQEHCVEPKKVLIVKKYLDNSFKKGHIATLGEDGYPTNIKIVIMLGTDKQPVKNMTDKQLFYLLQDRFKNIYSDKKKRDKFLSRVIKDWYLDKISKDGLLSVNMF